MFSVSSSAPNSGCQLSFSMAVTDRAVVRPDSFGFVMMTPQLFINYKLKSVAFLPWRKFIYRALNTFIDDLFSVIVRMPTMHRIGCFRDDIVFLIYLYQRHIYPEDKARMFDEDDDATTVTNNPAAKSVDRALAAESKKAR